MRHRRKENRSQSTVSPQPRRTGVRVQFRHSRVSVRIVTLYYPRFFSASVRLEIALEPEGAPEGTLVTPLLQGAQARVSGCVTSGALSQYEGPLCGSDSPASAVRFGPLAASRKIRSDRATAIDPKRTVASLCSRATRSLPGSHPTPLRTSRSARRAAFRLRQRHLEFDLRQLLRRLGRD